VTRISPELTIILAIDEPLYYALWYEPPDHRQRVTPRLSPPPARGTQPDVIPCAGPVCAEPIYLQPVDKKSHGGLTVTDKEEKLLRPTHSAALGPASYLFVGRVTACDKYLLLVKDGPGGRPDIRCIENDISEGVDVEGLVRLSFSAWSTTMGLHQAVGGIVRQVQVLELDPHSSLFGQVHSVPFGHTLSVDPDFVLPQETIFMAFEVTETVPLAYGPIPARAPDCPEPRYPGLVRLEEDKRFEIVELKRKDRM